MRIYDVVEELNNGKDMNFLADELEMKQELLKTKLTNAAVQYDMEKGVWEYQGNNEGKSLGRLITSKIIRIKEDKEFVKKETNHKQVNHDVGVVLYTDYLQIHQSTLDEKKSFFLTADLYNTIKDLSIDKSLRINPLINLLLKKGLQYYDIEEHA